MKDITGRVWELGGRVLSFRKKRKNQRKVDYVCCPITILVQTFFGRAIYGKLHYFLAPLDSPRASGVYCCQHLWLTQAIILAVSGFREWTFPV